MPQNAAKNATTNAAINNQSFNLQSDNPCQYIYFFKPVSIVLTSPRAEQEASLLAADALRALSSACRPPSFANISPNDFTVSAFCLTFSASGSGSGSATFWGAAFRAPLAPTAESFTAPTALRATRRWASGGSIDNISNLLSATRLMVTWCSWPLFRLEEAT